MPWKASSVMEERLRFVARPLDGEAMTDVCRNTGVSRVDLPVSGPLPVLWRSYGQKAGSRDQAPQAAYRHQIRAMPLPASGQIDIPDVRSPGLFLRLSRDARTRAFRFTDPTTGKRQRMTLARFPDLLLGDARDRAEELRKLAAKGINAIEVKRTERADAPTRTFKTLSDQYLKEHARHFKKSADADDRNLRLHILPKWGKRTCRSISRADIIELIEVLIADDKPVLANRVQSLVSKIFSFAVDADLINANPAVRLKKRGKETALTRTLDDAEIRLFWSKIMSPPVSKPVGLALKLALLTGLRAGRRVDQRFRSPVRLVAQRSLASDGID